MMSDLAASDEFDLELVAVSTDSLPVHRSLLTPRTTNPLCNLHIFVRVWREKRKGGGPMIMLSDVTGEVFRQMPFQSKAFKLEVKSIPGVSDLWGAGHQVSSCLQRPLRRRQPARCSGSKRGEFSVNEFPSQASYITSNLHQLPVDMDTADEVADLLRCEEHQ